ncbi:MAG: hypothetical protein Q8Q23_04320 [bacterium]|nr:hypothetical protein [bacterium]
MTTKKPKKEFTTKPLVLVIIDGWARADLEKKSDKKVSTKGNYLQQVENKKRLP